MNQPDSNQYLFHHLPPFRRFTDSKKYSYSEQWEFKVGDKICSNQWTDPKGTAEVLETSDTQVKCRFLPDGMEFTFHPQRNHFWITVK